MCDREKACEILSVSRYKLYRMINKLHLVKIEVSPRNPLTKSRCFRQAIKRLNDGKKAA